MPEMTSGQAATEAATVATWTAAVVDLLTEPADTDTAEAHVLRDLSALYLLVQHRPGWNLLAFPKDRGHEHLRQAVLGLYETALAVSADLTRHLGELAKSDLVGETPDLSHGYAAEVRRGSQSLADLVALEAVGNASGLWPTLEADS